jgi:enamine deaminase RidA (YjgF/YER057c/UK114 family)
MTIRSVQPEGYKPPVGYANGTLAHGDPLFIAGQIGWNSQNEFETDDLVEQFGQALDHVVAVVRAAGGKPANVAQMTVFVTDMAAYRAHRRELGLAWQRRMGRHYPAMALVAVTELVEARARVEIQAVAFVPTEEP